MNIIISINDIDVLIGLGTATHPGTLAYQELVDRCVSNLPQKSRLFKKNREQTYERIEDQEARRKIMHALTDKARKEKNRT